MKYAIVNNNKEEAFPKGIGKCICCNSDTIAKCGTRKVHHWAHKNLKHCDNWWENETEWHRQWKSFFPKEWQEIVHMDKTGEKHIADVKTDEGIILEFQNSPMSLDELKSREEFYKNVVWIVNGEKFANNFHILGRLPNVNEELFNDIAFLPTKRTYLGRGFFRYSENPDYSPNSNDLIRWHPFSDIEEEVNKYYVGHHLFDWVRPRFVWFESKCKVFLDFGGQVIWEFLQYDKRGLMCVKKVDKKSVIDFYLKK